MTTSSYMADAVVEIAFDSGYGTPAVDRTWTDVSEYVDLDELITITWGRQNERSQADANQCSLTFDNSDGRFTAERVTSPYYPNVKLDRPIRVKATPVDGSESVRFTGYINEWPVEWDGTAASAKAPITASSRLSRLGYTAGLPSIIEQTILTDSPTAYYTLGEPTDATQANDSSGNRAGPLTMAGDPTLPVIFGNAIGPGTDGLTAAEFGGGSWLAASRSVTTHSGITIEAFFLSSTTPVAANIKIVGCDSLTISQTATGKIVADTFDLAVSPLSYTDGQTHHVAATYDATTLRLYVDGVQVASTPSIVTAPQIGNLVVGGYQGLAFTGTIAHAAFFADALSPAQIADHAASGLTGFAGETTDERLVRYAGYGNILADEIDAEPGSTTAAHVDTTSQQVVELMRLAETTEGGALYDERDGTLTMHNRAHRYEVASAFTLDMGQHMVEVNYQPRLDRTYLVNDVTAANVAGTYSARRVDQQSVDDYGPMTLQFTTASEDDDAPLQAASWMVEVYKNPGLRVASCGVDALAQVDKSPSCADVLAVTVGDKITVGGHPQQMSYSSVDYFVEGGTETYGPESLRLTWNLSPTSPWDQTLILGDAIRGFLGTNPLAY